MNFHFFAYAALGRGLSGGDRIFIELSRRWAKKFPVTIYVWSEGYAMCQRQHLGLPIEFRILPLGIWSRLGFVICYFARIIGALIYSLTLNLDNRPNTVVYSASEFWMDSLPALVLKLRFPHITWAAAWYQTAPGPLAGFSQGRYRFSAFLYWVVQLPIKPLISRFADFVLINNETEQLQFPNLNRRKRTIIVLGAVDTVGINSYRKLHPKNSPKYSAVFQGRFHPQKGVVELIDIWKFVVAKIPAAKLAMIGDGPLMTAVKDKISQYNLEKNVELFGYVFDGDLKNSIFSHSQIVVHPAFYDSGGMAAAEAMAFGLPCVGFDLEAYKSYYPQGMVKVKIGDLSTFADQIVALMTNGLVRKTLGHQAEKMIKYNWSWDTRSQEVLQTICSSHG